MATFHLPITCDNITGSTDFKVKYRLTGDSLWTSFLTSVATSSEVTVPGDSPANVLLDNRLYDFQVQNINNADNPLSTISQSIGFTAPVLLMSPTSSTIGYSFPNLSVDIDSYTVQLTTVDAPGIVIETHILTPTTFPETITDTFTGLTSLTEYRLNITVVVNSFSEPFIYLFTTDSVATCASATNVTATLTPLLG